MVALDRCVILQSFLEGEATFNCQSAPALTTASMEQAGVVKAGWKASDYYTNDLID